MSAASSSLGFTHRFIPGTSGRTLLLLHGTGGNEDDLVPLARAFDPAANLLSPRGKILENGMPRFFRRLAEGVFDMEDLRFRAQELAEFVRSAAEHYQFDPGKLIAVGYSNGANIAAAILLLHPGVLAGAALLRAMVPLVPETLPSLSGLPVLIASGEQDPIVPAENSARLADLLRQAGAAVTLEVEPAGHGLTSATITAVKVWLERLDR